MNRTLIAGLTAAFVVTACGKKESALLIAMHESMMQRMKGPT